ncbi:hypothetical protein [Burkholderia phage vB_BglM_WTB]
MNRECMNVNLGPTSAFRRPSPEQFAILMNTLAPMNERWDALMRLDGFDPAAHPFERQIPAYAHGEIQRAYKIAFEIHKGL